MNRYNIEPTHAIKPKKMKKNVFIFECKKTYLAVFAIKKKNKNISLQ